MDVICKVVVRLVGALGTSNVEARLKKGGSVISGSQPGRRGIAQHSVAWGVRNGCSSGSCQPRQPMTSSGPHAASGAC